jgi:hypothetical protein
VISSILSFFGDAITPITNLIDDLHTSDEEKMQMKQQFLILQAGLTQQLLEYEKATMRMKADIIKAEASAQGGWSAFLTRSWRPIVMLTFTGLVVARWLGFTASGIDPALEAQLFDIIQLGIGGYIVGRSGEKVVKAGAAAWKSTNESKTE